MSTITTQTCEFCLVCCQGMINIRAVNRRATNFSGSQKGLGDFMEKEGFSLNNESLLSWIPGLTEQHKLHSFSIEEFE